MARSSKSFIRDVSKPLRKIVSDASKEIMTVYESESFNTETKMDGSPVTEADRKAHNVIVKGLKNLSPNTPVISEESYEASKNSPIGRYWLVDPLDGTKEFINKNGDFTVNIALIEEATPIFGIIASPTTSKIWMGTHYRRPSSLLLGHYLLFFNLLGFPIWLWVNRNNGPHSIIKAKQNGKVLYKDGPLRIVMSKSHQTDIDKKFLEHLSANEIAYEVVEKGSSLKLCALGDNEADIYPRFGPTSEWDIAAGHSYLWEKGGRICQISSGDHLTYSKEDSILNPAFVAFRNTYLKDRYFPLISEFYKKLL